MKPGLYDKMVEKLGKTKADNIVKLIQNQEVENANRMLKDALLQKKRLEKIIPKAELIGGEYYTGFRYRGKHVAMWDVKKGVFLTINYQFGFFLEELPYFLDVIDTNFDGFMPFAIVKEIIIDLTKPTHAM